MHHTWTHNNDTDVAPEVKAYNVDVLCEQIVALRRCRGVLRRSEAVADNCRGRRSTRCSSCGSCGCAAALLLLLPCLLQRVVELFVDLVLDIFRKVPAEQNS